MERHPPEQLNKPEVSQEYKLDDILQEFGKPSPSGNKELAKGDTIRFTPIRSIPKDAPKDAPVKLAPTKDRSTAPFPIVNDEIPKKQEKAAEKQAPFSTPLIQVSEEPTTAKKEPVEKIDLPPTPHTLFDSYRKGSVAQILRCYALLPLALFAVFLLVYHDRALEFAPVLNQYQGYFCLGALCLAILLSYEVFAQGVKELFRLRFSLYLLSVPVCVLALIHGAGMLQAQGENYCPLAVLLLAYLQYSLRLERSAMVYTLHTVCNYDSPLGIFEAPQTSVKNDSLRCAPANMEDYLNKLQLPNRPQRLFSLYAPCLFFLTAAISVALSFFAEEDFLLCWLLLLLIGSPWAAMLSYSKPFRTLARRLSKCGSALAGWHSARSFGKNHTIILRDEDLFPKKDISSNGMKLYGAFSAPFVISNALAVLDAVESPLSDLFEDLLHAHNGARMYASNYRLYDNDGIGAEVNGEDVLLGSLSFMRSMGVHMPNGAKVRQAVYISMRGELCGVFAIKYKPNPASKKGLRDILANKNFSVVIAARDFLVTPELIAQKYELSTERVVFPDYNIRVRLTELDPNTPTTQGALMGGEGFGAFASTVAAGRILRMSATFAALLSMLAGIGGVLLCTALIFWGVSISPLHLAVFQLIWTFLAGLSTDILLKF